LSSAVHHQLAGRAEAIHGELARVRDQLATTRGVAIPPLAIALDPALGAREGALAIDATPVAWLAVADIAELPARLAGALPAVLPELLGVDRVAAMVERAATAAPVLVREVVPRAISLPVLAEVLRGLVREEVPVEDLPAILEAIALAPVPPRGPTTAGAPALVEQLRGQLRRQISARWAPRGQLAVYTVDAMIEDAVRSAIDRREGAQVLALEPAIAQDIVAAVRDKLGAPTGDPAGDPAGAVILTSGDIRRHLRSLLEAELPHVAILAAHELAPGTAVQTAGRIEVA
ncbi:MAG: FHIPEP family type III secretion protein, partial [Kofleriaceae bacterium]